MKFLPAIGLTVAVLGVIVCLLGVNEQGVSWLGLGTLALNTGNVVLHGILLHVLWSRR